MLGVEWREVVQLLQPSVALSPTFKERLYMFTYFALPKRPSDPQSY